MLTIMAGGATIEETKRKKAATIEVFQDATFTVHKWHPNASELKAENNSKSYAEELTHAKQQQEGTKPSEGKLLGLPWDRDVLLVVLNFEEGSMTKRSILSLLAEIYDPLGLALPNTLNGKLLYPDSVIPRYPGMLNYQNRC